jgi:DNA-binding NarL/FixJ family response regulator
VLIVDDCVPIRERLAAMFREAFDAEPLEAGSAEEGLAVARAERPQVVVLDLHMPGAGAIQAVARLKALFPSPVVVVLTGDPTPQHRRACLQNGADYFLDKAGDFERMVQEIARPMSRGRSSDKPRP